ncbi:MAG: hypothetical protein JEZ00_15775 [Anaerolineaceae bacterium]|nr:hypothetical protein [Anaerolineaceae bacterium]
MGGDPRKTYQLMAGWWGEIPQEVEIPLIPLEKGEWFRDVFPGIMKTTGQLAKYRKRIPVFLAENQQRCLSVKNQIQTCENKRSLLAIWEDQIKPYFVESINIVIAASSDIQIRTEKELAKWVSPENTNTLLSNLGGIDGTLESLGPMHGLQKILQGEMTREEYLLRYGHRGENEAEIAWPRPMEDPQWLDKQLQEFAKVNFDIDKALEKQNKSYQQAWQHLVQAHPRQAKRLGKRLQQTAKAAQIREQVRSESVRGNGVLRAFALKAGVLTNLGENIFHLTIEEALALLSGDEQAVQYIPRRIETYQQYCSYPSYPLMICGRFEPEAWLSDPDRRIDLFNPGGVETEAISEAFDENIIQGFPGALGIVEGPVRKLEHLNQSDQLRPGEILLTTMTNIGWTPIFPRAAAIITDLGAPLSHAAIVARELGIPAVVGCADATARLKTGDRVRVDGGKGIVHLLDD